MAERFANDFATTLSAAVTDTVGTSISVVASAPAALQGGQFRIRVGDEFMLVTATGASGASPWTVTRGVEGSVAATHASAAPVTHVLTSASLQAVEGTGRGDVPEGGQKNATGKTVREPAWQPGTIIGNPGAVSQPGVIFAPVVQNVRDVLEQGGRMAQSYINYATASKATLTTGPQPEGMAQNVATTVSQATVFSLEGLLPLDEWTIEVPILSVGADMVAQAGSQQPFISFVSPGFAGAGAGGDELRVWRTSGGTIEARLLVQGTTVALASILVVTGEIPADTWKVISVTFKKSQSLPLRIMLGNNVRSSASGTGSAESGPGGAAFMNYVLSGFGIATAGQGLQLGSVANFYFNANVRVGMPTIRRAHRTYNTALNVKTPTIAVNPSTTAGAMPDTGGMLWQYQGWTPTGQDSSTSIRNQLATLHGAAGLKRARIEHIIDKAIITGTIAVPIYDWTPLWNIMDPLFNAGCTKFDLTLGYTPTLLGATQATVPSDFSAFAIYCQAFMDAAATRYGTAALASWSLWNEPDLTSFWLGTSGQMVSLWQAVHTQLATAYPTVSIGATENSSWSAPGGSSTATRAIIDQAATDGRRLDHIRIHEYVGELGYMRRSVKDVQAYFATKTTNGSFIASAAVPVAITEWNWSLQDLGQYESQTIAFSAYREPPARSEKLAAYSYAFAVEMVDAGVPFSSFTRAGITTAGSPNGAEAHLGAFSIDDPPRPLPVWAAFQALWKLQGTTRITATVNGWPSLRALAGKTAGGVITVTYGTYKPQVTTDVHPVSFEWSNLPATFTWKHWQLDRSNYRDGRLMLVAQGNETNLPIGTEIGVMGVGCIQITP